MSEAGSKLLSASGEIGAVAGKPVRLFAIHLVSGGTAGVVTLKNNGSSGTAYVTETGTVNTGKTVDYSDAGMFFPNGCYVSFDGNVSRVLASYRQVR